MLDSPTKVKQRLAFTPWQRFVVVVFSGYEWYWGVKFCRSGCLFIRSVVEAKGRLSVSDFYGEA